MSIFRNLLGLETRSESPSVEWSKFLGFTGGYRTKKGRKINENEVMGIAAAYACVKVISESMATLPIDVFEPKDSGRKKRPAVDDDVYNVFKTSPNSYSTPAQLSETWFRCLAMRGGGLMQMVRSGQDRELKEVHFIPADSVHPMRSKTDRSIGYRVSLEDGSSTVLFPGDDALPCTVFSPDGWSWRSPIQDHRETFGLAIGHRDYETALYDNGAVPLGILVSKEPLTDKQAKEVSAAWSARHQGAENAHKTVLLPHAVQYQATQFKAEDIEFISSADKIERALCQIYRMQPHKIAILTDATFSNIEHQGIEHVIDTLLPWAVRVEQALNKFALTEAQRKRGLYFKYNLNGLLRGAQKDRYEAYGVGIEKGFMTRNEARSLEDWDQLEGLDEPLVPLNMAKIGDEVPPGDPEQKDPKQDPKKKEDPKDPKAKEDPKKEKDKKDKTRSAFVELVERELRNIDKKWTNAAFRSLDKMKAKEFETWTSNYQLNDLRSVTTRDVAPLVVAYAKASGLDERDVQRVFDYSISVVGTRQRDLYVGIFEDNPVINEWDVPALKRQIESRASSAFSDAEKLIDEIDRLFNLNLDGEQN